MRKEPITSPFLAKSRDADSKDAIAIFKLVSGHITLIHTSKGDHKEISTFRDGFVK